jgi:hypothetical protein
MPLHPKIVAALLTALATALTLVVAAIADVYPDHPATAIVTALLPVIAGYLKSADAPA